MWHTFAGARINAVLARLLELELGQPVSMSNLSLKVKARAERASDAAIRVQEMLIRGPLPPLEKWAAFDTARASKVISS